MEKFNIKRDGVEIASDVEEKTYTDTGLIPETDYTYTVEISGVEDSSDSVTTKTTEPPNIFVSNKPLAWNDLPAWEQPDNGSLKLLSAEVKDNVPLIVETGRMIEEVDPETKKVTEIPEIAVQYETRSVYTYEADFEWDGRSQYTPDGGGAARGRNDRKMVPWLVDVLQFKNNRLRSGWDAFNACPATELTALPNLDTSNLTDMTYMFEWMPKFNQSVDNLDTSNVTRMDAMFLGAYEFNQPLNNFDTSNVTNMKQMFYASHQFDQPINHFNTSKVTDMSRMFNGAIAFNQPLNFDTRNVTDMSQMFYNAQKFNQNISNWCVSRIGTKPEFFDKSSGFEGQTAKHPKWGQSC